MTWEPLARLFCVLAALVLFPMSASAAARANGGDARDKLASGTLLTKVET